MSAEGDRRGLPHRGGTALLATVAISFGAIAGCGDEASSGRPAPDGARVPIVLSLDVDEGGLARLAAGLANTLDHGGAKLKFRTIEEIADRFGASEAQVKEATAALRELGIDAKTDPTRAALTGTVAVGVAERVFGVDLVISKVGDVQEIYSNGTPEVPPSLKHVTDVVRIGGSYVSASDQRSIREQLAAEPTKPDDSSCPETILSDKALANHFLLHSLARPGADGKGIKISLLAIGGFLPESLELFDSCSRKSFDVKLIDVVSATGAPPELGDSETATDMITMSEFAPRAAIDFVRFDESSSIVLPLLEVINDAASGGATPDLLVAPIGFCEQGITPAEVLLGEWLLSALAATGTTSIAASGDYGSSACHPRSDAPIVNYPASSAWVTAVGGADSFTADRRENPRVWHTPEDAGGGGVSELVERPTWQAKAGATASGRAVPDLAMYAGNQLGSVPVCSTPSQCVWQSVGGTSVAAIALAGAIAAEEELKPLLGGNLGPAIYAKATEDEGTLFIDVAKGDNELFSSQCCRAEDGFDLASGWGVPNLAQLAHGG